MLWAKRQGTASFDRFIDALYPPFWCRDLDIDDLGALESILADAAVEHSGFRSYVAGEGRREHDQISQEAFEAGVFGVPTYLVADEMWFGREHLPRVQWLLGNRRGDPPVVENRGFQE